MQAFQNSDVFLIALVLIAGDVSGRGPFDLPHGVREAVPIRFALSIHIPGAFNLVCGRGHPPEEAAWKAGTLDLGRCHSTCDRVLRRRDSSGEPAVREQSAASYKRPLDETSTNHKYALVCDAKRV